MIARALLRATSLATVLSLVFTSVASADNIYNTIDASIDATAESVNVGVGASATVNLKVDTTNSDGKQGCNLTGSTTLVTAVASSATGKATVAPSSITWTSCGQVTPLSVTGVAAGSATVSLTETSNSTGGTFDLVPATFTVTVTAPAPSDTTPPVITPTILGTLGNGGWYTSNVSLSWSVTDAESAVSSQDGCEATNITADQASTDYTCSASSAGGTNTQTVSIKRDATAPTVTPASVTDTTWRKGELSQAFTASDSGSGLAAAADASFTLTASDESANATTPTTASRTVYDVAGNSTTRTVSALIDRTAPTIGDLGPTAGPDGSNGWYVSAVTNEFDAADALSGLPSGFVTPFSKSTGTAQGSAVKISSGAVADVAGNSNPGIDSAAFKIDLTNPTITLQSQTGANTAGWNNTNVTVTWTCADSGSDVVDPTVSVTLTEDGEDQSATGTCTDNAGRTISSTVTGIDIDKTAPTVTPADVVTTTWRNGDLSQTFAATDAGSGLATAGDASFTLTASAESTKLLGLVVPTVDSYDVYDVAGNKTTRFVSALIDLTAPVITDDGAVSGTAGTGGWYTSAVTNQFSASDPLSGLASSVTSPFTKSSGTVEGSAVRISSGAVADLAGNTNTGIDSATFKIDLSDPTNIAFVNGPAAGSSYYFGSVPAAPTCTASDATSGLKDCVVTGYLSSVGTQTMTATATDNAGRTATATRTYTVLAWTARGFYSPVDMNGVVNTVKNGQTVPLKFELFAGPTEITDVAAIETFKVIRTDCATLTPQTDDIELYSTGGTTLRYDTTGGQFIQNWQVPKGAGICYTVTMTADDGSKIVGYFKTK